MPSDFRNLEIWREAQKLTLEIYKITSKFPKEEIFGLEAQIRRSAVSVAANIAESFGRYHSKDKIQLLMVARGSIYETCSHLSIALGLNYIKEKCFEDIDKRYEVLSKRLNVFINYIRKTNR